MAASWGNYGEDDCVQDGDWRADGDSNDDMYYDDYVGQTWDEVEDGSEPQDNFHDREGNLRQQLRPEDDGDGPAINSPYDAWTDVTPDRVIGFPTPPMGEDVDSATKSANRFRQELSEWAEGAIP